ncbi:hypothetical protein AeNC1_011547, partial [Aphanomyces euteiches]
MEDAIETTPPRRGPYKKTSLSAKRRIVAVYDAGGDWKSTATANGIKISTAMGWLHLESWTPKQRGGYRQRILTPDIVDRMEAWVEFDCQITLDKLQARLRDELDINVSTSTINRALDERVFTYKNIHDEPLQLNDETLKAKRQQYVQKLRELLSM